MSYEDGLLGSRLTAARAAKLDHINTWTDGSGTKVMTDNNTEQDLFAEVTITEPTHVIIELDLNPYTTITSAEISTYAKTDGTSRKVDPIYTWTRAADQKIVAMEWRALTNYKVTVKQSGADGAGRTLTFKHYRKVIV